MKKLVLIFVILVSINNIVFAQIQTIWQKSAATNNLPGWFSTTESSETGIAYRQVNGQNHLYVVSNKGGESEILILNADNGDSLGKLNTTGISGGTYRLFDVETGFQNFGILACNLTTNPTVDPFKIYGWENETSVPKTLIIDSTSTGIWGEKFTAVWPSVQWETSPIVTVGKNTDKMKVYIKNYWDSVFTRQVITLPFFISSGNPTATNVYLPFNPPHHFYINVDGQRIREISEIGSLIATDTIVPVNSNSIKSFFNYTICCDNPFYISYQYGGGKENAVIVRSISVQYSDYYAETPTLGTNPNPFNRGDVAIGFSISGLYNPVRVFVLSANNGIGCYLTDLYLPVELENFSFYIDRNDVILNWKTATETNNYGFEIQRKKGDEYDYIGFVNGVGTTTQAHEYSFIDKELLPGKYKYRLKQIDFDGSVNFSKEIEINTELSIEFKLHQNYPNPVNPTTAIKFSIPSANNPILGGAKRLSASGGGGLVTLKVYDALGREVTTLVNEVKSPGNYEVTFKANALASGIYYYRLKAGDFTETKKMILLR